jgi:hypothetical protein
MLSNRPFVLGGGNGYHPSNGYCVARRFVRVCLRTTGVTSASKSLATSCRHSCCNGAQHAVRIAYASCYVCEINITRLPKINNRRIRDLLPIF